MVPPRPIRRTEMQNTDRLVKESEGKRQRRPLRAPGASAEEMGKRDAERGVKMSGGGGER